MKKKILKLFIIYSYISLALYVGSENSLAIAQAINGNGNTRGLKIESLWKTTFKRFKETIKLIMKSN